MFYHWIFKSLFPSSHLFTVKSKKCSLSVNNLAGCASVLVAVGEWIATFAPFTTDRTRLRPDLFSSSLAALSNWRYFPPDRQEYTALYSPRFPSWHELSANVESTQQSWYGELRAASARMLREDICNFTAFSGTLLSGFSAFNALPLGSTSSLSPALLHFCSPRPQRYTIKLR